MAENQNNHSDLITSFTEITSSSIEEATFFLESHNFDLDSAVSTFFETTTTTNTVPTTVHRNPNSEQNNDVIWTIGKEGDNWNGKVLYDFKVPVWRVSWSLTGNILAVAAGDNNVTLWKEAIDGEWQQELKEDARCPFYITTGNPFQIIRFDKTIL